MTAEFDERREAYFNALYALNNIESSDIVKKVEFMKKYTGLTNVSCSDLRGQLQALELAHLDDMSIDLTS
jgi:hypothetical protein